MVCDAVDLMMAMPGSGRATSVLQQQTRHRFRGRDASNPTTTTAVDAIHEGDASHRHPMPTFRRAWEELLMAASALPTPANAPTANPRVMGSRVADVAAGRGASRWRPGGIGYVAPADEAVMEAATLDMDLDTDGAMERGVPFLLRDLAAASRHRQVMAGRLSGIVQLPQPRADGNPVDSSMATPIPTYIFQSASPVSRTRRAVSSHSVHPSQPVWSRMNGAGSHTVSVHVRRIRMPTSESTADALSSYSSSSSNRPQVLLAPMSRDFQSHAFGTMSRSAQQSSSLMARFERELLSLRRFRNEVDPGFGAAMTTTVPATGWASTTQSLSAAVGDLEDGSGDTFLRPSAELVGVRSGSATGRRAPHTSAMTVPRLSNLFQRQLVGTTGESGGIGILPFMDESIRGTSGPDATVSSHPPTSSPPFIIASSPPSLEQQIARVPPSIRVDVGRMMSTSAVGTEVEPLLHRHSTTTMTRNAPTVRPNPDGSRLTTTTTALFHLDSDHELDADFLNSAELARSLYRHQQREEQRLSASDHLSRHMNAGPGATSPGGPSLAERASAGEPLETSGETVSMALERDQLLENIVQRRRLRRLLLSSSSPPGTGSIPLPSMGRDGTPDGHGQSVRGRGSRSGSSSSNGSVFSDEPLC